MKKLLAMLLALAMAISMLTVAVFAEADPGTDEVEDPDDLYVEEPSEEPEDSNPGTGVVFAVLPMVVAGAAVAFAKKH